MDKLKLKSANDDTKINDYKQRLEQMEETIGRLEAKIQCLSNKELEWTRSNNESAERIRVLTNQSNNASDKLEEMKQKLSDMADQLTSKSHKLQSA